MANEIEEMLFRLAARDRQDREWYGHHGHQTLVAGTWEPIDYSTMSPARTGFYVVDPGHSVAAPSPTLRDLVDHFNNEINKFIFGTGAV